MNAAMLAPRPLQPKLGQRGQKDRSAVGKPVQFRDGDSHRTSHCTAVLLAAGSTSCAASSSRRKEKSSGAPAAAYARLAEAVASRTPPRGDLGSESPLMTRSGR